MIERGSATHLWLVSVLALTLTFLIALVTPLHARTNFWLRGPFYMAYLALFLAMMLPLGAWLARGYHRRRHSFLAMILLGCVTGYLAGLLAFLLHPLLLPDGFPLFVDALGLTTPEAVIATLQFPIRLLSWLYGGIMAILLVGLMRLGRMTDREECTDDGP